MPTAVGRTDRAVNTSAERANGPKTGPEDGSTSTFVGDLFVDATWKGRWLLLGATLVGGVVGLFVANSMSPSYQAAATLLVAEPRKEEPVSTSQTVRAVAASNTVASRVLADLGLNKPPRTMTPEAFRAGHLDVEEVRGSRLIRITVTLPDATLAARGADKVAQYTVDVARSLNQEETVFLRDYLRAQLDAARTRKAQLEEEMTAFRGGAQVELLEADADALLQQRGRLLRLVVDIAAEEARVAAAERELPRHERIVRAPRRPQMAAALADLPAVRTQDDRQRPAGRSLTERRRTADEDRRDLIKKLETSEKLPEARGVPSERTDPERNTRVNRPSESEESTESRESRESEEPEESEELGKDPGESLIPLDAVGEFVNPVYEVLEYQLAAGRTRLAALQRQRQELIGVRKLNAQQIDTLSTLYRQEIELRKLQTEYDLAERIYLELALKHEQARVQAVSGSSQAQILDRAVPPSSPVAPRKRRIVAAGAVAGLLLSLGVVVFAAALGFQRRR